MFNNLNKFSLLFVGLALLLSSCASSSKLREEKIGKPAAKGSFETAIGYIEKNKKDLYNTEDAFLYEFDLGVLYHYAKDWDKSIKHLAEAQQILYDLYTRSVTNEAAAIVTNDNVRPYRSYPFEEQWLYQIQILNFLAKGEIDGAVVESRRALLSLRSLQEKQEDKFRESGALQYLIALSYERQDSEDDARIAYGNAKKAFEKNGLTPKQVAEIPKNEQEIIIVGYAGSGPVLKSNEFWGTYAKDGALFLNYKDAKGSKQTLLLSAPGLGGGGFSGQTMTIQFAIPEMVKRPTKTEAFSVSLNNEKIKTETFENLDESIAQDIKDGQNNVLLRTAARVIVRTIAATQAKKQMKTGNGWLNLLMNIGTDVATYAMEQADLRLGIVMPKTLQIIRLPVEAGSHEVQIDALDSSGRTIGSFGSQSVNVKKGEKVFLFAPSLN